MVVVHYWLLRVLQKLNTNVNNILLCVCSNHFATQYGECTFIDVIQIKSILHVRYLLYTLHTCSVYEVCKVHTDYMSM